jgi:hypothetical protein
MCKTEFERLVTQVIAASVYKFVNINTSLFTQVNFTVISYIVLLHCDTCDLNDT